MSAVVIDGGLVHYEAFGRGNPPVLFLHGWIGSWRYWMSTMEAISDKHRTYALDLWGFGDSDKSRPRYDIKDYIALIDNFADNMGIRNAGKIMQRACKAKGCDIEVDGIVGSGTRKAINDCNLEKDRVKAYRIKYYCDLVNKKPEQERFFYGWVRRSLEV